MQIDIFSLPIFVNNIDSSKIIVDNTRVDKRWNSETYTTFGSDYIIQKESLIYLLNIINETIFDFIKKDYKLELEKKPRSYFITFGIGLKTKLALYEKK